MIERYRFRFLTALMLVLAALPVAAQTSASITGQITDESGASIPAASVTVLKGGAQVKSAQTNEQGSFTVPNLAPGTYSLRVSHFGFSNIESRVQIAAGQRATFNTQLKLQAQTQSVTVQGESVATVSVDASQNAGALVLKQAEIDALPDDPDDLATDLQQLAGPSAGPNGGQIYIDGFTGGRLPPKESIREIRINQNPFSSEYDRLGYGRIEILTKPGSDKIRGQAYFNDSDGVFNARNPFLTATPDFSSRMFGGNVGGSFNKKTSFFVDVERRSIDDSGVVNARILDPNLNPVAFNEAVATPQGRTSFSPRIDYALNSSNTLVLKYNFERNAFDNSGVGQFALPSQGINNLEYEHSIQLTETAILSPKAINETRFRWLRNTTTSVPTTPGTTVNIASSFVTGGSSTPKTETSDTNFELQNYTSMTEGRHALKFGLRIRSYSVDQTNAENFLGSFNFSGGPAPVLNADNQPVIDGNGNVVIANESSLEQYRRTLLFQTLGYSPTLIRQLGGGASQFSIAGGNPNASLSQVDAGLFLQDDFRLRPNLTVNFGLRYEIQNQISDFKNFAPRLGFAWSPDATGNKQGKTVIRGGSGMFYERFQYEYSLNGEIFNGRTIQRYVVTAPDFFPNVPSVSDIAANVVGQTIQQVDANLHAPYVIQSAIGVERALPHSTRLAVNYMNTHGVHQLRTRNINAPDAALGGNRPYGEDAGNIYNYESTGIFNQNQLIVSLNTQFNTAVSLFSWYTLNSAKSNTDGINTFPANQYNLSTEYNRAQFDNRHRLFLGGSVTARYGLRFSPFIFYSSGRPYNITAGNDYLDQIVYSERPSFTDLPCGGSVVCTSLGKFNTIPAPGETIIPRNYGDGPGYFSMNLRVSKTFGFGEKTSRPGNFGGPGGGGPPGGGRGGPPGGGGMMGGPRGMGGMFGDASSGRKYSLTVTAQARNLFNNVNYANPIGVITSPFFGTSNQIANFGPGGSSANNRRLEFGLRFSF